MLRINRVLLFKGYRHARYLPCKVACLDAAQKLLDLSARWAQTSNTTVPGRWWPVTFGLYSAAVVFFIDLTRGRNQGARGEIIRAITMLR